jgi:hypothetical protein
MTGWRSVLSVKVLGESFSIRLWEREAYLLKGARTSPKGEVRESKHAVEPGANRTGPCGRPYGRQSVKKIGILTHSLRRV